MEMNKTVLTIEESLKLTSLGVPEGEATYLGDDNEEYVFTLTDLLSILPKKITDRRKVYNLTIGVNSEDLWYVKYINSLDDWDSLNSYQDAEELCDCIYDMIVWLKENKELKWL